jgi:hypothetical protein
MFLARLRSRDDARLPYLGCTDVIRLIPVSRSCFSKQVHKQPPSVGLTLFPNASSILITTTASTPQISHSALRHKVTAHHGLFHFRHVSLFPGALPTASRRLPQDWLQQRFLDQHRSVHSGLDSWCYSRLVCLSCRFCRSSACVLRTPKN